MKNIIFFGSAIVVFLILTGSAAADDQIDTSNIFMMGYYNPGSEIDLSIAIQEFDHITEITDQYVEGKLIIWHDNPGGINPGNIYENEYRGGVETDIPFATNITVRVMSDGWIVAWLINDQDINDMVFWNNARSDTVATDTTIGKAIWRITNRVGTNYDKDLVNYYSYKYPDAGRLVIGGRTTHGYTNTDTYFFLIPSATTVYKINFISTFYIPDQYHNNAFIESIDMDGNNIFYFDSTKDFKGLFEYARYYKDISDIERDTRHTVYIVSDSSCTVKSVIAILYQSDPSNMNYLIDTEFTVIDKSLDQSFEQTLEQIPRQTPEQTPEQTSEQTPEQTSEQTPDQTSEQIPETSTENDTNIPGYSLFAALSVLLIIVYMKQKKR